MRASGTGELASMGAAVPYSVAVEFYFPGGLAIALTGDGAMQMNGRTPADATSTAIVDWQSTAPLGSANKYTSVGGAGHPVPPRSRLSTLGHPIRQVSTSDLGSGGQGARLR